MNEGYTPTRQEVAKRDVAVQAERSWWIRKLREMAEDWQMSAATAPYVPDVDATLILLASHIDALCTERERP